MTKRIEQIDKNLVIKKSRKKKGMQWLKVSNKRLTIRGLWWMEEERPKLRRLPSRAEGVVRPDVWELAQSLAGARVCFRSNTTEINIRAKLNGIVPFAHMPATGHSGMTLYVGGPHELKPWSIAVPEVDAIEYERDLLTKASREMREYTLYLPPYNGLESLEIGLSAGARIEKPSPTVIEKPAVFYGTSITQGGCANNAGGDYPSILGRALNLDVINLGFSGNGQGEPEVAGFISEIDASLFALDYVANVPNDKLKKTLPTFVKMLRSKHPKTPILLMSRLMYSAASHSKVYREAHEGQRDIILEFYTKARRAGDSNIHFVDGNMLISYGADLAHVDGGHPTGLGFDLMAKALEPQVKYVLGL